MRGSATWRSTSSNGGNSVDMASSSFLDLPSFCHPYQNF
jgi:hypothetical protein